MADEQVLQRVAWRPALALDAADVRRALDEWWDQRLHHCVGPQVLEHFGDTSLLAEVDGRLVGFLIGWLSQRHPDAAYVHFMGVRPDHRRAGIGRELYRRFAALARARGRTRLLAECGAFNRRSLAFHQSIGFTMLPGDMVIDGVQVHHDDVGIGGEYIELAMDLAGTFQ
jgi:GNAT superfamily N-acetyltransferase